MLAQSWLHGRRNNCHIRAPRKSSSYDFQIDASLSVAMDDLVGDDEQPHPRSAQRIAPRECHFTV